MSLKIFLLLILLGSLVFYSLYNYSSAENEIPSSNSNTKNEMINLEEESRGIYEEYAEHKLAYAKKGKLILFFKADWCASCSVVDETVLKSLEKIPKGVVILKADFDSETELRKKYGVTVQHTFIQINSQGEMIEKWSGGITLDDVIEKIN